MPVVPLFETLNDLQNAEAIVESLFSLNNYLAMIKNKQEIMVGYSDSAKDAGRLAASWAQYESQEKMVRVAERYQVELTFFHGKGGTVGRGGNPACKTWKNLSIICPVYPRGPPRLKSSFSFCCLTW